MTSNYDIQKNRELSLEKDFFFTGKVKIPKKQTLIIKFFWNIYSKVFSFNNSEDKNIDPKKLELQRNVDTLLINNSLKLLGKVLKNGYELTKKQAEQIEKLYDNIITDNNNTISNVSTLLSYEVIPQKNNIHKLFFSSIFQIYLNAFIEYHEAKKFLSSIDLSVKYFKKTDKKPLGFYNTTFDENCNSILDYIYLYLEDKDKKKELFNNWFFLLKNYNKPSCNISEEWTLIKPYYIFKYDMVAALSLEQSHELISHFSKLKDCEAKKNILADLNQFIENNHFDNVNNLLKDIKATYLPTVHKLGDNNLKVPNAYFTKDTTLPVQAQDIINSINNLYLDLSSQKHQTQDYFYDIQIVMDKHIPNIIEKYTSIAEQYRNTLVNRENKTAHNLLLESLNNIYMSMDHIHKDSNHDKLRDLSVSQKYTNELIKRHKV